MTMERKENDGYDGFLYNPATGRIFRANEHTNTRLDLVRVSGPNDRPKVSASKKLQKDEGFVDIPIIHNDAEDVKPEKKASSKMEVGEADAALSEIVEAAEATDNKAELKALGAQIGVPLMATMKLDTMRGHIKDQVASILEATAQT